MENPWKPSYLAEQQLRGFGVERVGTNVQVSTRATVIGLENISFGSNVRVDDNVVLLCGRGKLEIGSNVHIEPGASLVAHHGISIGDFCTISHGVRLFTASADYSGNFFTNPFPSPEYHRSITGAIVLEKHVIVGGNSVVMPNVTLGEGAAIGALSFVRESVGPWFIYAGNPLKTIKRRTRVAAQLATSIENAGAEPSR